MRWCFLVGMVKGAEIPSLIRWGADVLGNGCISEYEECG